MYVSLYHQSMLSGFGYACERAKVNLKLTTNYWLSVALAFVALLLGVSALLLWVIFPRGFFPSRLLQDIKRAQKQ